MRRPVLRATIGAALAVLTLSLPATASADGQKPTKFVDCTTGSVIINDSSADYRLTGACSEVVVNASGIQVAWDSARHVVVTGSDLSIVSVLSSDSIEMHGFNNYLFAGGVGTLRMTGDHLSVNGSGDLVKVRGSHNLVKYERLRKLVIKGSHNEAHARQGKTEVKVTGRHNKVKVHKRR